MRTFVLPLVLVIGCGGPQPGTPNNGPRKENSSGGPSSLVPDASVSLCVGEPKEEKDVAPCVTDCTAGIVSGCLMGASFHEHAKHYPVALGLLEQACELKDPPSCVSAARMHASGMGTPPSRQKQIDLLEKACHLGDPFACAVPARAFTMGSGVPKDPRRANELYQRACAGGQEDACEKIADAGL